ncbi:MAG: AMP-binding protein [Porticoccaceae bacterium]|nr:MAG: AMP-binding protein [Porticoccaceae bacterium]
MSAASERHGPPLSAEEGLGALTLPGLLAEVARRHSEREALVWHPPGGAPVRLSYRELYGESLRLARALAAAGIGRGSRVGILMANRPEWVVGLFGATMTGAVAVALNTFATPVELRAQLELADVELLLFEAGVAKRDFVADLHQVSPALAVSRPGAFVDPRLPFLRRLVCVDLPPGAGGAIEAWHDFLAAGETVPEAQVEGRMARLHPVDDGLIFFSSGTTGSAKGIQHSHRAAALQCWRARRWYGLDERVRTWCANGFFWSGNFAMALGSTLAAGGCLVLQHHFEPDEALALMERERVSFAFAWPHQYARLRESPLWERVDLSSLHYVDRDGILASHPSVRTQWREPNGYGSTETFTFVAGWGGEERSDASHGPVLPGNSVRILDPDTGALLPLGETGEIAVKGPTLTRGYLRTPPEETFDRDGYLRTADAGRLDAAGHLWWEGRLGDMIKTGGANVAPAEVDQVLARHPAVRLAVTVGVPDPLLGERVVACVVAREGMAVAEEELIAFARAVLAPYKVPRRVLFFSEGELPVTGSNKVRRRELAALAAARLGDG